MCDIDETASVAFQTSLLPDNPNMIVICIITKHVHVCYDDLPNMIMVLMGHSHTDYCGIEEHHHRVFLIDDSNGDLHCHITDLV